MKKICLCFQIHHPFSYQTFRFLDIGESKSYYDELRIEKDIVNASKQFYFPTNDFLLNLINQSKGKLKLSFYISGTTFDQFLMYVPKMIESFKLLADTGQVEFIGGTASHSVISLAQNNQEFQLQINNYKRRILNYFGQKPKVFVNTDLLFSNQIAQEVAESGYQTMMTNGGKKILQWRSPNYLYSSDNQKKIKLLFRNEEFSNELTSILDFSNSTSATLQINDLITNLRLLKPEEPFTNIYLNYNTLNGSTRSVKQKYFGAFITRVLKEKMLSFCTLSELEEHFGCISEIGTEEPNAWVEHFHPSYYPGNVLQKDAIKQLYKLEKKINLIHNKELILDWQYLQSSDHFHLMDENHPAYNKNNLISSIYRSKYDAYINYMNIIEDFRQRLKAEITKQKSIKNSKKEHMARHTRQENTF